jgi:hypothetical protein
MAKARGFTGAVDKLTNKYQILLLSHIENFIIYKIADWKDDLYSSIKKDNVKSINLHISKGFKPSSEKRMKYIESLGVNRNDGNIRLHKKVRK